MDGGVSAKALGQAMRERRASLGLTARELGARIPVNRTYVESIERGERNPSLKSLNRLALALDAPLSSLVVRAEQIGAESSGDDGR
ncbi:MAG TPA: helix-turn-helix transcriptional regulator [Solirubrobacteraceae bacterium]|nr:helix-turn-helix transcriptional regulator [Solirubrobacteraceae bacterium]